MYTCMYLYKNTSIMDINIYVIYVNIMYIWFPQFDNDEALIQVYLYIYVHRLKQEGE
jgi:hypothetical protein